MRYLLSLAIAVAIPLSTMGDDLPKREFGEQLVIRVSVFQGDPSGSVEEKTVRVFAQRMFVPLENMPIKFEAGNQIVDPAQRLISFQRTTWRLNLELTPGWIRDGKIELDLRTTLTSESGWIWLSERITTREMAVMVPLEAKQRHIISGSGRNQVWMEFAVEKADPIKRGSEPLVQD